VSIRLSEESGEIAGRLQRAFRLPDRPSILRLALAIGIREAGGSFPQKSADSRGPEIPLKTLTGGHDALLDALVVHVFREVPSPVDLRTKRRVYKRLVDLGLTWLAQDYDEQGRPVDYLAKLAERYMSKVTLAGKGSRPAPLP